MNRRIFARATAMLMAVGLGASPAMADTPLRLATTTSTDNSGLLGYLLPHFEKVGGYQVQVIATGTGKALRMGRDGDVDVVLVHAPGAEQAFVDAGYGETRYAVMVNDFVLVGPATDPAGIGGTEDVAAALQAIVAGDALFVSRGDDSGTHKKELSLWHAAGVVPGAGPGGKGYREAGQGMGKVLQMAGELDAYTLTDRGTWLAYQAKSPLRIVSEGDPRLFNPYSIIAVSQARYPDINHAGAQALIDWIVAPPAQQLIGEFRINGEQLFTPSAQP